MRPVLFPLILCGFATLASARTGPELETSGLPERGPVAEVEGLAAWDRAMRSSATRPM
ncbi:MAG: hypothetical protein WBA67_04005 [Jannaschia sp.]